jgi:tetratricopeptide (TPR) repeat protein
MGFTNEVLWDFGVVITRSEIQNVKEVPHLLSSKEKKSRANINAVITDPFIPPVKKTFLSKKSSQLISEPVEISINQIKLAAEKSYFNNNYQHVIEILYQRDLSMLSKQNRESLNYLLAVAYYRTGYFDKAQAQALSLLKQNESDKLYLLMAMIYESLGDIKSAKDNYIKLISFYPESDYFISAKIKTRILNQH